MLKSILSEGQHEIQSKLLQRAEGRLARAQGVDVETEGLPARTQRPGN